MITEPLEEKNIINRTHTVYAIQKDTTSTTSLSSAMRPDHRQRGQIIIAIHASFVEPKNNR